MADETQEVEKTEAQEILGEEQGYQTLKADTIERLKKLEVSDADIEWIDKAYVYTNDKGEEDNFANGDNGNRFTLERFTHFLKTEQERNFAYSKYCQFIKYCYPDIYYGRGYNGSEWFRNDYKNIYGEAFVWKTNWLNVPTFEEFSAQKMFQHKPYIGDDGMFTDRGLAQLDEKYQNYLKDCWPEYWSGKVYNNRKPVTTDSLKETKEDRKKNKKKKNSTTPQVCEYTEKEILVDIVEAPSPLPIEEAHYFAIFCGNDVDKVLEWTERDILPYRKAISEPVTVTSLLEKASSILTNFPIGLNLTDLEGSIDELIEKINSLQAPSGGLPAMLKNLLLQLTLPIVAGLVWNKVSPYIKIDDPNNIDPKQMCKDALKAMLKNFWENVKQMILDMTKEVRETIDEIITTAKGLWDNIISLPKTVISMITAACMPQTIPTTGGIPNPITVLLDIINIIDSILALFPPIIQDILKILMLLRKLMVPMSMFGFLNSLIEVIKAIISALKKKKEDAMSYEEIHKAIKKSQKKIGKLERKRNKLLKTKLENGKEVKYVADEDQEEYDEYNETIENLTNSIADLEKQCPIHGKSMNASDGADFETQMSELGKLVETINNFSVDGGDDGENGNDNSGFTIENKIESGLKDTAFNNSIATGSNISSGNNTGTGTFIGNTGNTGTMTASPLQSTNITPYCGKVFV